MFLDKALAAAAAAIIAAPVPALAQLTLVGPANGHGTGFGNVSTVLTLQNTGTETGCIGPSGVTTCALGDAKTGASQTNLFSVGNFPGLTGSNLRLFLNFSEPQNSAASPATLNNATLTLYNGTTALFSSSTGPVSFSSTTPGIGTPDFVFALSTSDAATFNNLLAQSGSSAYTLGLNASLSNVSGGPETFFLGTATTSPTTVPEPSSMALLATGIVGLVPVARRKLRK